MTDYKSAATASTAKKLKSTPSGRQTFTPAPFGSLAPTARQQPKTVVGASATGRARYQATLFMAKQPPGKWQEWKRRPMRGRTSREKNHSLMSLMAKRRSEKWLRWKAKRRQGKYVILRTGGDEIQPKGLSHAPRN